MILLHRLRSVIRWVFRRGKVEEELDADIQSFIDLSAAEKVRGGLAPDEARRMAILEIGGAEQAKEKVRTYRYGAFFDEILQDLRYAFRTFGRNPGFALIVILTLALGIGANTAIFSLMDALMLKSLPIHDPDRLVEIASGAEHPEFTPPVWEYIRDHQQIFDGVLAYMGTVFNLASSGEIRNVNGLYVSGSYFDVLGVRPMLGRLISPNDDVRGCGQSGPVAVLSYGFWQSDYGGMSDVIGKSVMLDGLLHTIIGVSPPQFGGLEVGQYFDVAASLCTNDRRNINLMGRLKPEDPLQKAAAGLAILQSAAREATRPAGLPGTGVQEYLKEPFLLRPAGTGVSRLRTQYSKPLLVLMSIVGMVLLVACGNIASLLLARATARTREIALRLSIGASRFRLIRQLLVESIVLSLAGSIAGIIMARVCSRIIVSQLSTGRAKIFLDLSLDGRVLAFTIAVAILTGLLFGIVPAIRATRWNSAETLREMTGAAGIATKRAGAGRWLVSFQIGLSLVLIFGAALFLRSYQRLTTGDHGFQTANVLLVTAYLPDAGYGFFGKNRSFQIYLQGLDAIRALPGVQSAAYSITIPVAQIQLGMDVRTDTFQPASDQDSSASFNLVSPGYFSTFGIPLIAGRDLDNRDIQDSWGNVAIVNEAFARRFFPGRNPVGMTFRKGPSSTAKPIEVVGVVRDSSYDSLRQSIPPTLYLPVMATFTAQQFAIRTPLSAAAMTPSVIKALDGVNKSFAVGVETLKAHVDDSIVQDRLMALLSAFFGILALIIAAVGLAGLVSYSIHRRRAEMGIRSALGATPTSLVRMVMREVILLTAGGIVFGLLLGLAAGRFVATMLYQVKPTDPLTLGAAVATLVIVAVAAGYIPARRAARIDPMECLRSE